MDPDVSDAIDSLRSELRERGASVNLRFETLEERMNARFANVDARFAALEERMNARFAKVDARFGALEASLISRIDAPAADTRRYFDIVIESLRDGIRIVARASWG
jgi:hypothetical protein